ncbi:MAG: pyridoxamine 5'-phosphate oxidase family protein [Saprospiraceae bacterium]|nr:pyridoxamine 5'-phosphate oxidase family protein [Candidatus Brachybacter algidus]
MMSTDIDKKPFHSVVMSTKQVDSEGKIWFYQARALSIQKNIEKDGHTYLMYSDPGSFKF